MHLPRIWHLQSKRFAFVPAGGNGKTTRDSKGITSLWQGVRGAASPCITVCINFHCKHSLRDTQLKMRSAD